MLRRGYLSPEYVASQAECGQSLTLPRSGGWLLERLIPGSEAVDAIGPYPIFCCSNWSALSDDLADLGDRLVSLVLVTDPFGPDDPAALAQGEVGYCHLAAYSPRGYAESASYALFWASAERLRGRVRWLSLGAGAGATCDGADGLTRFKRGWSPLVRPAYLGRHVARPERYAELCRDRPATDFFPAYRYDAA
jgi:hypothetical protein